MLLLLCGALLVLIAGGVPAAVLHRQHVSTIANLRATIIGRENRITQLEAQVDSLHAQGLRIDIPAPPAPVQLMQSLPPEMQNLVDDIEDPTHRASAHAALLEQLRGDSVLPPGMMHD